MFWEYAFAIDKYLCCGELWGLLEGLTMLWPTVRRHKCHRSSFVFSADWFLHFGSVLFRRQTQQPNSAQYDGNCITGGILMLRLSHYKGHLFRPSGPQRCSYSPVSQPGQRASTSWLAACSPRLLGPLKCCVLCIWWWVLSANVMYYALVTHSLTSDVVSPHHSHSGREWHWRWPQSR